MSEKNNTVLSTSLEKILEKEIKALEQKEDIVVCTADLFRIVKCLSVAASSVLPNATLTLKELSAIKALIYEAIHDEAFFDWEKPTLIGATKEELRVIAEKLPG